MWTEDFVIPRIWQDDNSPTPSQRAFPHMCPDINRIPYLPPSRYVSPNYLYKSPVGSCICVQKCLVRGMEVWWYTSTTIIQYYTSTIANKLWIVCTVIIHNCLRIIYFIVLNWVSIAGTYTTFPIWISFFTMLGMRCTFLGLSTTEYPWLFVLSMYDDPSYSASSSINTLPIISLSWLPKNFIILFRKHISLPHIHTTQNLFK